MKNKMEELESCELCGKKNKLVEVIIEGSMLSVCQNCSKFGKTIIIEKKLEEKTKISRRVNIEEEPELIVANYSELIKQVREKKDLKQEELAKKISEKESVIHKIESGQLKPSILLARKLEKFLKIKLVENYLANEKKKIDFTDQSLTIGDLIKFKKK